MQSNGVLRAIDFDAMLLRHPNEVGIAVDHNCALILDAGRYKILPFPEMPGSICADGVFRVNEGTPGVWLKRVVDGAVMASILPVEGPITAFAVPATGAIIDDPRVVKCRADNPAIY